MLPPEYYRHMDEIIQSIYLEIEKDLIEDISRELAKDMSKIYRASDTQYRIDALSRMGYQNKDIEKILAQTSGKSQSEIAKLMRESAYLNHMNDQIIYKQAGKLLADRSPELDRYIAQAIKNARGDIDNLTKTLGVTVNGENKALIDFYRSELSVAQVKVGSGAYSYNDAVESAIRKLTNSGIRTIDWKSGHSDALDVAVRRAVRTANAQATGKVSLENADLMGQDLMEITSHWGARPTHADWQGQVVSRDGKSSKYLTLDDIGYETGWGFQGFNCRHDWFPYFEGYSSPAKSLPEPEPKTIDGERYTYYEATQRQREYERRIRATNREISGFKGAGAKDALTVSEAKLKRQTAEYRAFSKQVDIYPKWDRTTIDGKPFTIPKK